MPLLNTVPPSLVDRGPLRTPLKLSPTLLCLALSVWDRETRTLAPLGTTLDSATTGAGAGAGAAGALAACCLAGAAGSFLAAAAGAVPAGYVVEPSALVIEPSAFLVTTAGLTPAG